MKILIVSQYFWPEEFRINDLALGLKERGHEVVVMTGIPNYPSGSFFRGYNFFGPKHGDFKGIKIIRVPLIPRGQKRAWQLALNYLSFVVFGIIPGIFYCRGKFDLIFVAQFSPVTIAIPAIILKKIKKIPVVLWVQDLWPESLSATGAVNSKAVLQLVAKLVRWIYKNSDRILVQSQAFISLVEEMGVKRQKIQYLPNWAEVVYQPMAIEAEAPERKMIPPGFIVMFAGNIGAAQDFETILSAAERLKGVPNLRLVILGDGRMRGWVEEQIKMRALEKIVYLLGKHPVETMPRFFSLADVMLVTLKREPIFALTIPAKTQSYLACGKPILMVLDGEGARVAEEAQAGLIVPAENPQALADTVLKFSQLPLEERETMGKRGRQYFEKHFERDMLIARADALCRELKNN